MFEIELIICIKMDLALNNLQRLIYHETQTNKQIVRERTKEIRGDVKKVSAQTRHEWPRTIYTCCSSTHLPHCFLVFFNPHTQKKNSIIKNKKERCSLFGWIKNLSAFCHKLKVIIIGFRVHKNKDFSIPSYLLVYT